MKSTAIALLLFVFASAFAESNPPLAIEQAFKEAHILAQKSSVRNLFMFNYTYFANGLCADQDCSPATVSSQMDAARKKMGDDFAKYSAKQADYAQAIMLLQAKLPKRDLATVSFARSFDHDISAGAFVTCVDFAKVVMGLAIRYGYAKEDLKFYVTMADDGFKKMCPALDGRAPNLPRPVVHTLVAYKNSAGNWYVLNVEDPDAIPISVGAELPKRLGTEHLFTYPPLIAYQKLVYAGAYAADLITNGFPANWLISITAAGRLEADLNQVKCE